MRRNWFRDRLGRKQNHSRRAKAVGKPRNLSRTFSGLVEYLEDRRMLSVISWVNRGTNVTDSDNFQAIYGANATLARAIVDRAIDDWETVIQNFNFSTGGNTFSLTVNATDLEPGVDTNGSRGSTNITSLDANRKPTAATIRLDDDAGSEGTAPWFFDSTPNDDSEFNTLLSPGAAYAATDGGAFNGNDFYRTILHEMGHAMGISRTDISANLTALGQAVIPGGTDQVGGSAGLVQYIGPDINATFVNLGGYHVYEGPADPTFPNESVYPNDLMNAGRTDPQGTNERQLISDVDALILKDAYGYDVRLPSTINNMYANFNSTTGVLTIQGDPGNANDNIFVDMNGSLRVQVNGTEEVFDLNQPSLVTSIVINTGDGNDNIRVDASVQLPTTINAGNGDDTIYVGSGATTVTSVSGDGADYIDFSNSPAGVNFTAFGGDTVIGSHFSDTFTVDSTTGLQGNLSFTGNGGSDLLVLTQTGGPSAIFSNYTAGPKPGDGEVFIFHNILNTERVRFYGFAPVQDDTPAITAVVTGTDGDNAINYTAGLGFNSHASGLVTIDNQESYEFANKTNLQINAGAGDDVINLNNSATPPGLTGISVDGQDPTASDKLIVNGTTGADTINYTESTTIGSGGVTINALPAITFDNIESLVVDGQGGSDNLTVTTPAGGDFVTYTPGNAPDAGLIETRVTGTGTGTARVPLTFQHLGSGGSLTLASGTGTREDVLELNGTNNSDLFTVNGAADTIREQSATSSTFNTLLIHTGSILFATLRGLEGDDQFNISGTLPYSTLEIEGGDPSASDTVNLSGASGPVTVNLANSAASTITSITGFGGMLLFDGVEVLNANANNNSVTVNGTTGPDDITTTPTGANSASLSMVGLNTVFNFAGVSTGGYTVNGGGGSDKLSVEGTQGADNIDVNTATANAVAVNGLLIVHYNSAFAFLQVDALAGIDVIDATPSATTSIFVDGGDPIGKTTGDEIRLHPTSLFTIEPGPESDEGSLNDFTKLRVSWDHIEVVVVVGNGSPALVMGTNGDDDITIIARDSTYDSAADGVQDFTVSVNDGPSVLYINQPNLFVDALAGDDDIVVREPAPNNAVWNVQIYVAGGTPEAPTGDQGDVVEVETPGTQTVSFAPSPAAFASITLPAGVTLTTPTPSGIDTALFTDTTNTSTVSITPFSFSVTGPFPTVNFLSSPGGAEQFVYQGDSGNDQLSYITPVVSGNAQAQVSYTPGATGDSGTITGLSTANGHSFLPLVLQSLGSSGSVAFKTADASRNIFLQVYGTAASDLLSVQGAANTVQVSDVNTIATRSPSLLTPGLSLLELHGLAGRDNFQINAFVGVPFAMIVDGGDGTENDFVNVSVPSTALTTSFLQDGYTQTLGTGLNLTTERVGSVALVGIANPAVATWTVQNGSGGTSVDEFDFTPTAVGAGSLQVTSTGFTAPTYPVFGYTGFTGNITVTGGSATQKDTIGINGTNGNDFINADQPNANTLNLTLNTFTQGFTFSNILNAKLFGLAGDDLIRVNVNDALETTTPAAALRYDVDGGDPNASDRLIVNDDGLGDLIVSRQSNDLHSGSVTVGLFAPVVYKNIERLDITPLNPITGGTGTDGNGRIKVFHTDPYELNDSLPNSAELQRIGANSTSPNIDPGAILLPPPVNSTVPGDDDWYVFRPQATGTFQVKIVFSKIAALLNGRPGLPGAGDLDLDIYDANGVLITSGTVTSNGDGKAAIFAATNDPTFSQFNTIYVRVHGHTPDSINTYDFDNIAALITGLPGVSAVDLEGPQVTDVRISDPTVPPVGTAGENLNYNLFGIKPGNAPQGPTPLVNAITINFKDLPARFPGFLYPALDYMLTADQARGLFQVIGDATGIASIKAVIIHNDPVSLGGVPTGEIQIIFDQPLPDDRFTLTINDSLRDPAQNRLDGESNSSEPNGGPFFPSGDGHSGGNYVARFTVDTRPEIGNFAAARVYIDINGNSIYDPQNVDFTNRDLEFTMQLDPTLVGRAQLGIHDSVFAGNFFNGIRGAADGFDKLGVYGTDPVAGPGFRWLIDTDDNGTADLLSLQATGFTMIDQNGNPVTFNPSGIAFAGNFDGDATNGDEVGLFDGTHFYLDTNHSFSIDAGDTVITTALRGFPIVGDFNGDGTIDLGTWQTDVFQFNFGTAGTGGNSGIPVQFTGAKDAIINFGFPGVGEVPLAADMDHDGITDIGLWVPGRAGTTTAEVAETFFLTSHDFDPNTNLPLNTGLTDPTAAFNLLNHAFSPTPLGHDLYSNFLDEFATPIVGNFDPPAAPATAAAASDNVAPTSSVNALAASQSSRSFNVSWSGSDGNGIAGYDVYVSDNGGSYTLWQDGVTTTSATFTGVNGHSYKFFSVATDNSGNVQDTPAGAQATTSIQIRAVTTTALAASNTSSLPGQSVTFTATIGVVDSSNPTATGTVTFKDGNVVLSTVALVDGVATLSTANLAAGNHSITATYNGVAPYVTSTSAVLVDHIVNAVLGVDPNNSALTALFVAGSAGNDIFTISPSGSAGAVMVTLNNASTKNKAVSLGTFNPTGSIIVSGLAGNDSLQITSATVAGQMVTLSHPISFSGGDGTDTLVGANTANVWDITGANAGTLNGNSFDGVENLIGGVAADNFVMHAGASLAGKITGGAGANTLDYSAYATPVTLNLQTSAATGMAGAVNINNVVGNGSTTLVGPNKAVTWNITAANAGNVNGVAFSGVSNLTGGTAADTFNFANGAGINGTINGGGGIDTLKYTAYTTPVTVNLSPMAATGAASIASIEAMTGGSAADTLIGPNQNNAWSVSNTNTGKVNAFTFSSVENLTGGAANDNFVFAKGKGVTGAIDGSAGINMLDYAAYTTAVNVNLATGTATNVNGGVSNIRVVRGGSAADNLTGDDGDDALIGGAGNDTLTAGSGRNLLFGGLGADTLKGGAGESILFSGTTTFDTNLTSIDNLLTYWARNDLDYATRVAALKAGTAAGAPKLSATTVKNDTSVNTLNGGSGLDWFFAKLGSPKDTINNQITGEQVN